jgi:hypothetical protein
MYKTKDPNENTKLGWTVTVRPVSNNRVPLQPNNKHTNSTNYKGYLISLNLAPLPHQTNRYVQYLPTQSVVLFGCILNKVFFPDQAW